MRRAALLAAVPLAGYAIAQVLGRRAGATRAERRQPLPGDQIMAHPQLVTDHATTIGVLPEEVAVAHPARLAPRRVLHAALGRPVALPGERADAYPAAIPPADLIMGMGMRRRCERYDTERSKQ